MEVATATTADEIGLLRLLFSHSDYGLYRLLAIQPKGDPQKSVEPFSLDVSTLDELTEKPASHEAAYLMDMARIEALDTLGENRKAVELLDRHV